MKSGRRVLPDVPRARLVVSTPSTMNRLSAPLAPSIWMPLLRDSLSMPGDDVAIAVKSRPLGMRSMTTFWMSAPAAFCLTSISGASDFTCTLSATPPTAMVRSIFSTCPSSSCTLDALAAVNP